jgi:hypothetical protein
MRGHMDLALALSTGMGQTLNWRRYKLGLCVEHKDGG